MPHALLGPILGVGGALLSSIGNKGQTTTGTNSSSTNYQETPQATAFRNSLYGPYGSLLAKAGQPMYGAAEQAGFQNNLNAGAEGATKTLAAQIAARGGSLNSGAFGAGATNIAMGKLGQQADYATKTPMLNKQAYLSNMSNILGLGMNFAGRAPVNSTTTGTTSQTTKSNSGFFGNFANSLGAMLGGASGGVGGLLGGMGQGGDPNNVPLGQGPTGSGDYGPSMDQLMGLGMPNTGWYTGL